MAMGWKFWQKNESSAIGAGENTRKLGRPRDLPQEVGRHLVVMEGLDPDWAWSLKCVLMAKENAKNVFDIRVYDSESANLNGVMIKDYRSLDDHMELVLYAGVYDKGNQSVQLQRLMKDAV
jgi:hypothetical protein